MATATVTRPAQALRNRRDAPRSSLSKRQNPMDSAVAAVVEPASKRRKLTEPYVRDSHWILAKHAGKPPSLVVHLHDTTFRFEGQDISWTYDSTMSCVIRHLKRQTVPHELMEELLSPVIPWYDGCLIVEIHNHRAKAGKEKGRPHSSAANDDGNVKFGMHNYTPHVTPSPMVPFPSKAVTDESPDNATSSSSSARDMPVPERPKDEDGPTITTMVLHPTSLSLHQEMLILTRTPADQLRSKKRGGDSTTASAAQPSTPQTSVPPTPLAQTSRGPLTQSQKMCLEEGDWYAFQGDLLITTEPPLFLDPVDNPQDADKVLDMLQHPLHQAQAPSLRARKRTTAEVAADDAQAAETERRMLIMDERIKPAGAGAGANENQTAAASLGFSRFKTMEMVRQRQEEAERAKKEEEARLAMEKKQQEEQNAAQLKQEQMAQRQRQLQMLQQQQPNQQSIAMQMQMRQARAQQAILMNAQAHGHPQANGMLPNGQPGFSQQSAVSMPQSSPVVRQQTPMMNSSPMTAQGGFPMAQTSSQGAGSPPRPTSAAMQNPMARQGSQQLPSGRNNTPQLPQGTPGMVQAMPNRATTQTPRMQPSSPNANMQQGTPTSMPMQTPQMASGQVQYTPEQLQMLAQQRLGMGSAQPNSGPSGASPVGHMTPDQITALRSLQNQYHLQQRNSANMMQQARQQGDAQMVQRIQQDLNQKQQMFKVRQQQIVQGQLHPGMNAPMGGNTSQAGSPPGIPQATPQMTHANAQQQQQAVNNVQDATQMQIGLAQQKAHQLAAARQAQQLTQAQQQLQNLSQQYGGYNNIPPQVLNSLGPAAQNLFRQHMRQQSARQHQQAMRNQAGQQQTQPGGGEQVPGSQPNPQYMQHLRQNQAMLAQHAQQQMQNQQAGGNNMGMLGMQSFTMNGMGGMQGGGGGNNNNNDLSHHIAAMANALSQPQNGRPGGGVG